MADPRKKHPAHGVLSPPTSRPDRPLVAAARATSLLTATTMAAALATALGGGASTLGCGANERDAVGPDRTSRAQPTAHSAASAAASGTATAPSLSPSTEPVPVPGGLGVVAPPPAPSAVAPCPKPPSVRGEAPAVVPAALPSASARAVGGPATRPAPKPSVTPSVPVVPITPTPHPPDIDGGEARVRIPRPGAGPELA